MLSTTTRYIEAAGYHASITSAAERAYVIGIYLPSSFSPWSRRRFYAIAYVIAAATYGRKERRQTATRLFSPRNDMSDSAYRRGMEPVSIRGVRPPRYETRERFHSAATISLLRYAFAIADVEHHFSILPAPLSAHRLPGIRTSLHREREITTSSIISRPTLMHGHAAAIYNRLPCAAISLDTKSRAITSLVAMA